MVDVIDVTFPVRYFDRSGPRVVQRMGVQAGTINHLDAHEAPVAVQAEAPRYDGTVWGVADYRAFDGRLYVRQNEVARYESTRASEAFPVDTWNDAMRWKKELTVEDVRIRYYDHPFLPDFAKIGGAGGPVDIQFDDEPSQQPEFLDAAAEMRRSIAEAFILDNDVWVPSTGPLLVALPLKGNAKDGISLEGCHANQPHGNSYAGYRFRTFSALDIDLAREIVGRHYREVVTPYRDPVIRERDGWSIEDVCDRVLDDSLDHLGWYALWLVRMEAASDLPRRLMERVVELRRVVGQRWGEGLDFNPTTHSGAAARPKGAAMPLPDDLAEPVAEVIEAAEGHFHPEDVKAMRMMHDVLLAQVARRRAPAALADIVF